MAPTACSAAQRSPRIFIGLDVSVSARITRLTMRQLNLCPMTSGPLSRALRWPGPRTRSSVNRIHRSAAALTAGSQLRTHRATRIGFGCSSATATLTNRLATLPTGSSAQGSTPPRLHASESVRSVVDAATIMPSTDRGLRRGSAWLPVRLHREVRMEVVDRAGDRCQQPYAAGRVHGIHRSAPRS
jgi:hypothetical protein